MVCKSSIGCSRSAAIAITVAGAKAFDDANYPELAGGWFGMGGRHHIRRSLAASPAGSLDSGVPEILEASLADQANGGQGEKPGLSLRFARHAAVMIANVPLQFLICRRLPTF